MRKETLRGKESEREIKKKTDMREGMRASDFRLVHVDLRLIEK